MLQINNLTVTLTKDLRNIIESFTFTLNKGDRAVIIGEEGNGKSTLLKLIYDEGLVSDYCEFSGEIVKNKLKLAYLAQELTGDILSQTVYEHFSIIPNFWDLTPAELTEIARPLSLNLDFYYSEQIIGTLSGGERIKLQLISLMLGIPDVLLLDEPSNDIDIETLEWLESFINNSTVPVLFVSHDETLIENTANLIIHIEQIRRKTVSRVTVKRSNYNDYISERFNAFEKQTQVSKSEHSEFEKQQDRFRKIYQQVEQAQNSISRQDPAGGRLLKKKMKTMKAQEKRFDDKEKALTEMPDSEEAIMPSFNSSGIPSGKMILELEIPELKIDDKPLSENIKLIIKGSEKICIIGKNGTGKTTLLREISALLLNRTDINAAYMPQNYFDLLPTDKTPIEYLAPDGVKTDITKARTYLGSMKYTADEMLHNIEDLSGGQKAKLLFLKMILDGANVLILDEPTRNFSPLSNPVIRGILKEFNGAIISVSHDRKYIAEVSDKVYVLTKNGLFSENRY